MPLFSTPVGAKMQRRGLPSSTTQDTRRAGAKKVDFTPLFAVTVATVDVPFKPISS